MYLPFKKHINAFDYQFFNFSQGNNDFQYCVPFIIIIHLEPQTFIHGKVNTITCPPNSIPILDLEMCKKAANQSGGRFNRAVSWRGTPTGCSVKWSNEDGIEYFTWNRYSDGTAHPDKRPVCILECKYGNTLPTLV